MNILSKIDTLDDSKAKKALRELVAGYLTPAFGSISKRDFDILLFMKFQELGLIDSNPEIYELVTDLRVTRAKARNLLYEAKLRASTEEDLDNELKILLKQPIFLKDNDKIAIEIENPYLTDHIRFKLKKLNHLTDGSFSPELIKLTVEGYIALFEECLPKESKKEITHALIKASASADTSFKGVMKGVLKKIGTKVAGDAGNEIAGSVSEYLTPIIDGSIENITSWVSQLFEEDNESKC